MWKPTGLVCLLWRFLLASYYLSKSRFLKITYALSFVLFILLHFSPILDKVGLKPLPPNRDPVKVAIGWELLGKEVSKLYTGQEIILSPPLSNIRRACLLHKGTHAPTV